MAHLPVPPHQTPIEKARIAGAGVFLGLMVVLTISSVVGLTPNVDLGVFGTLMGGFLACVAAGPIVKFVGK